MKTISKKDFEGFVENLIQDDPREVIGVQEKGNKYVFDILEKAEDLRLDYDVTILPPKKYFTPQRETLLKYKVKDGHEAVNEVTPRIILGIHPYDLEAIRQMDKVFSETYEDKHYLEKREASVLVGMNMEDVSEWSFAGSMGTATIEDHYDIMLTDIGDNYVIEIGSEKGSDLLDGVNLRDATEEEKEAVENKKDNLEDKFEKTLDFAPEELPELLEENYDNVEFWEENSEKCYSCGSCNLVCPTCYCFDVKDINEITLDEGKRIRQWDGCLLEEFAIVAGDENFREERYQRYRHRFMRKGRYIYERYDDIACVGCGRCGSHCVPDIADPTEVYNSLKEVSE
ncbi:MAG: 4Fe-4S dicluster domain-containing protein [Candidatus Saliniplasma sp.]